MMKTPGYYYYCLYQKRKTNKEKNPQKNPPTTTNKPTHKDQTNIQKPQQLPR